MFGCRVGVGPDASDVSEQKASAPLLWRMTEFGGDTQGAGRLVLGCIEFAAFVRGDFEHWGRIIRESGIKAE